MGSVFNPTPDGGSMQIHPYLLYTNNWSASSSSTPKSKNKGKRKGKTKLASYNIMRDSSRKADSDVILYPDSEDKEGEILYAAQTDIPFTATTQFGNQYLKQYDELAAEPSQPPPPEATKQLSNPLAKPST